MKANYYIGVALSAVALLSTTGCALLDKSEKYRVQGSDGTVTEASGAATSQNSKSTGRVLTPLKNSSSARGNDGAPSAAVSSKAVKNSKKKKKGKNATVSKDELAEARREVAIENAGTDVAVATLGNGAAKTDLTVENSLPDDFTINGEWTIFSVRGNQVTGEERPYVNFDLAARRFYGSNGCNIINGDLVLEPKNAIRMENMISTMRMCDDAPFEYLINLAVSDVKSFSARQEGPITFIDLKGADGRTILVLRRHNMDFLNGAWKITALNGTPLAEDGEMTIDIPELKIHGTTGCNTFNGALFIDPDKVNSMQFIDIATTRMMCSPESRETEFLLALESVETAKATGKNTVTMFDTEGKELFTMQRLDLRPEE